MKERKKLVLRSRKSPKKVCALQLETKETHLHAVSEPGPGWENQFGKARLWRLLAGAREWMKMFERDKKKYADHKLHETPEETEIRAVWLYMQHPLAGC